MKTTFAFVAGFAAGVWSLMRLAILVAAQNAEAHNMEEEC